MSASTRIQSRVRAQQVHGREALRRGRGIIELPTHSPMSGSGCVAGVWFHNMNSDPTKPYVWCHRDVPAAVEKAEGPTVVDGLERNPVNVEILRKAHLHGDFHVDGL
jgi:hypothetical protein